MKVRLAMPLGVFPTGLFPDAGAIILQIRSRHQKSTASYKLIASLKALLITTQT